MVLNGANGTRADLGGAAQPFRLDAFEDSEQLFGALTSHTPVGIFVSDVTGECVYVNDRWCELAGMRAQEALGDGWTHALHPDDAARVLGEWAGAANAGRDSVVEYRFQRPGGDVAWIRGFASPIRDGGGQIAGWTGICLDITTSQRREFQQQAVAEFGLRTLSGNDFDVLLRDAVETLAAGLDVEYASFLELLPDGESILLRAGYGWKPADEDVVATPGSESPAAQALRTGEPVLVEHPDGKAREGLLMEHGVASSAAVVVLGAELPWGVLAAHSRRPHAFSENDLFFLRGVANILAAALTRSLTEKSVRELASIVESSSDAIWRRTPDGILTSWNAAAEQMFGYSAQEMIGRSIAILVPPELRAELAEINEGSTRGETIEQFETARLHKDGTRLDVAVTISPIKDASGRTVAVSVITRDVSERKRGEAALRESEARARAVLDSALDGVMTIDHTGAIVEFNPAAEVIFGRRREDVLGRPMVDIVVPPSLRERHRRAFARAIATGSSSMLGKRVELPAVRADGTEFPVELTVNAVSGDGPPLFTGFVRDITERRQAESKQRQLSAIVGAADDAIFSVTAKGIITSWNAGSERIYGYSAEEVIGRSAEFMVLPEQLPESKEIVERLRAGERIQHHETVRMRKDGTRFDVALTIAPIQAADGLETEISVIARDITERKRAEAQLRRSEARYRDLFENATDLIATVDLDARFTDVNTAFAHVLGYTREELIGRPLADVVPAESLDPLQSARRDKLEGDVSNTVYEHDLVTKDGRRVQVEVSSRVIVEDGAPVGIEAICRDVSERKRLEAQLRQAQKMEAVGQLAGGIAHDFNNLLTVINGNADRALGLDDLDAVKASLGAVLKAGTSAAALTGQLLAFSRLQVLRPRVLDLAEVLANIDELLRRLVGDDIQLEVSVGSAHGNVRVDPNQIEQVLLNLVVNARDAMPAGGSIRIGIENTDVDEAYASTGTKLEPGRYVELTVSDSGGGMDEETKSHVFEPFFTTKEEGTGLGLATAYGIVKQSDGYISVYSEPGTGTTFRILLPRVDAMPEQDDPPPTVPSDLSGTETILVIEDNDLVRALMAEILTSFGYTVLTAGCAEEVHELAPKLSEPLDLVVSDVMLPGQPGPELVELLRRRHPDTKCIFTSGYAAALAGERGGFELSQPFLAKPFTMAELASLVREVLDG